MFLMRAHVNGENLRVIQYLAYILNGSNQTEFLDISHDAASQMIRNNQILFLHDNLQYTIEFKELGRLHQLTLDLNNSDQMTVLKEILTSFLTKSNDIDEIYWSKLEISSEIKQIINENGLYACDCSLKHGMFSKSFIDLLRKKFWEPKKEIFNIIAHEEIEGRKMRQMISRSNLRDEPSNFGGLPPQYPPNFQHDSFLGSDDFRALNNFGNGIPNIQNNFPRRYDPMQHVKALEEDEFIQELQNTTISGLYEPIPPPAKTLREGDSMPWQ